jgi:hypothetical protein
MNDDGCIACGCLLALTVGVILVFVWWGPIAGLIAILIAVVLMRA